MRNVFVVCLIMFAGVPAAALAQSSERSSTGLIVDAPAKRIEQLFSDLKRAGNEQAAARVSARILQEWSHSGSASVDLLMQWSQKAIDDKKNAVALDLLDQVVTLAPDYAEGWNRRATVHFIMDNYGKAMADLERVLRLEPRHFGALAGLATILKETERKDAAMHAYERLLDVYPMLRDAQTELGRLADETAGQGI